MKKNIQKIITHPLFSGSTIMIVGSNTASVLNYLYHFLMGRLLGPSSYGELVSLISVIGLLGVIPGSINLVIVKYISSAKSDKEINNVVSWFKSKVLLISLTFSTAVLITSPVIASFLHINRVFYVILIAISLLFALQAGFSRSILQGLLKFKEMVMSILIENSMKLILSTVLVYLGFQVNGAMAALIISILLGWLVTNIFLNYHSERNFNLSFDTKSILKFTVPVVIQTIAMTSLYSSDIILVKHFFSSHDAGIYAAISTLGKIIFFGTGPINTVMLPLISQRRARGQVYKKIFFYSFLATGIIALSISVLYGLIPRLAITLLFGGGYIEAESLLIWFAIFISLFTLSSVLVNYNLSLGKVRVTLLPLLAAIAQIIVIFFLHQSLFMVVLISIIITALLLLLLLIYSTNGYKFNFSNSAFL